MIPLLSYGMMTLAFVGLAALASARSRPTGATVYLLVACFATAAWGVSVVAGAALDADIAPRDMVLETVRSVAWIVFLQRVLKGRGGAGSEVLSGFGAAAAVGAVAAALVFVDLAAWFGREIDPSVRSATQIGRIGLAVFGLMLIENVARNDQATAYWSTKFAFAGMTTIFGYDLFLHSEALLFNRLNPELFAARGIVDTLAVPLFLMAFGRNPRWPIDVHLSRAFVFHTFTLIGSGSYLLIMGLAGYYLRSVGGSWGSVLQVTFLALAGVFAFLVLSSGAFRSRIRKFISRHFFSYKHDYKHEWLQLIRAISAQESILPLPNRVVETIANSVDSPAGALWAYGTEEEEFRLVLTWNMRAADERHAAPAELVEYFERTGMPLRVDGRDPEQRGDTPRLPSWVAETSRAWVVVPLIHREALLGIVVLLEPRAPTDLVLEDYELLSMIGRQTASYLAEEEAGKALADARRLEEFNTRFAFVVHDIKNLASQLSLVVSNAARHGGNPEFQRDAMNTVRHSVERMNALLAQLRAEQRKDVIVTGPVALAALVRREWSGAGAPSCLRLALSGEELIAEADAEQVLRVLRHIVQNAIEAIGENGKVEIALHRTGDNAVLSVTDNGSGMTAEFIRDELFRPFRSTKRAGYGIGAYQARQIMRDMGGRLEVTSEVDRGTEFRLVLPLCAATAAEMPQVHSA